MTIAWLLAAASGALVGFMLGLVGGGGSILAVPLLVYIVGVHDAHVAIGTSALAVAANALLGLANHARAGTVKWRCGLMYAAAGVIGAAGGSILGKAMDGQHLLFLFAGLMIVVGVLMLRGKDQADAPDVQCGRQNAPKTLGYGLATGAFSGFFGIGGGFLIVPGLMAATAMPMFNAVGTSLVAVSAFGLTTTVSYALSGYIDWPLAGAFIVGGGLGTLGGAAAARRLASSGALRPVFAVLIFVVAAYMLLETALA